MSISSFMGYPKGKRARMIFEKHANLKYKFGNRSFWATGYYARTAGMTPATIRNIFVNKKSRIRSKIRCIEKNMLTRLRVASNWTAQA